MLSSIPITATASGSLNPVISAQGALTLRGHHTREVEEVGVLMEVVEDGTRAVFDVGSSEDGDSVIRKACSKS